MSFWGKIKQTLRSFMGGRHGVDQLSTALVWAGLVLYLLGLITGLGLFSLLGFAAYVYTLVRMFSRDNAKRNEENRRYMAFKTRMATKWRQARARFRNRKTYKYFKCPNCKAWLKVPRNTGIVTVTCSRCHNSFTQKA